MNSKESIPRWLTNYHIKLLAALFMLLDHLGVVLLPDVAILRVLGRFSFPLFGWLLVQGEQHTSSVRRYALRLLGLAILSQPIYMLTFSVQRPNILFTLLLSLLCLRLSRRLPEWEIAIWLGGGALATVTDMEYGIYGIAMIALISHFKPTRTWWMGWVLLHLIIGLLQLSFALFQTPAIFAPIWFSMATHQHGAKARWFYLFYPLHLLALVLVRDWILN